MFDASHHAESTCPAGWNREAPAAGSLASLLQGLEPRRRLLKPKGSVFRAGQAAGSLFLVNSGVFKTCIASDDGREKVTGFRLRGELLGLESLGESVYAGDAVALSTGEVWEYTRQQLAAAGPAFQQRLIAVLSAEIRRDWQWMLVTGTLCAERKVIAFLLDMAARLQALGYSSRAMGLQMTRSEIGNFLALQLETVVRALSRLQSLGLIGIDGKEIVLNDPAVLHAMLERPTAALLRAA